MSHPTCINPAPRAHTLRRFLLASIALALWLCIATLYLVYLTRPLALVLELDSADPSNFRVATLYAEAKAHSYKPEHKQKNASTQTIEFALAFEQFDDWRIALPPNSTIHLSALALKGMFGEYVWTRDELEQSIAASPKLQLLENRADALVLHAKSGAVLARPKNLTYALTAARAIPIWLNGAVLFAMLLTVWLLFENLPRAILSRIKRREFARPRLAAVLMWLLLGYGAFRLLTLVTATPLIGYANNGDFGRILSCFGLETYSPHLAANRAYPEAPLAWFQANGTIDRDYCYLTSESGFVQLALLFSGMPFSIQTLGLVRALCLIAAGVGLTLLYQRLAMRAALISAGLFALFVADPMNGLYLNTFFLEFSMFFFAYASLGLLFYMLLARVWDARLLFLFCLALFGLGLAKMQTALLPAVLAVLFVSASLLWLRQRVRRLEFAFGIGMLAATLLVIGGLQMYQSKRPGYVQATYTVNAVHIYFLSILPNMDNPSQGVAWLGLPPLCAEYVGKSLGAIGGREKLECSEIKNVTITRGLALFAREPSLFWRLGSKALPKLRLWRIAYLGWVGGGEMTRLDSSFLAPHWSFASLIEALPQTAPMFLLAFLSIGTVCAIGILGWMRQRALSTPLGQLALIQLVMMIVILYSAVVSFWGDGLMDFAKHMYITQIPFCVAIVATLLIVMQLARALFRAGTQKHRSPRNSRDVTAAR